MQLRVPDEDAKVFKRAAKMAGVSLSAWARLWLRKAARREFEDAKLPAPFIDRGDDT